MRPATSVCRFDSRRWLFLLPLLLFLACHAPISFAATKTVTEADKDSQIHLNAGDTLLLRLQSNPTTGYMWYVHPKSTNLLKLTGQTDTGPAEPGVGRPIMQVFEFQARHRGEGVLLLHYVRSWQKPAADEKKFEVHVTIE